MSIHPFSYYKSLCNSFIDYCKKNGKPVIGNPRFLEDEGTINVIAIRNNGELSFNSVKRNNDILYVVENRPNDHFRDYQFEVTTDPAAPITLRDYLNQGKGRAHLCEGAYESYVVRPHQWTPGRTALGQDGNEVVVARSDNNGVFKNYDRGFFGINVHDPGKFWNSSLGCIIISFETRERYTKEFKPTLLRAKQVHAKLKLKFSVFLINYQTLKQFQS